MTDTFTKDHPLSIFISHRHVDSGLADVFREEISDWSSGQAIVYQSSSTANASKIGARLDVAIAKAISNSNLILLIYTHAAGDYDWCMYECGLAQDPESLESNIAVFFTTEDLPDPMDNRIGIRLDESSIKKFVFDFHRTEEFFARHSAAYNPDITDDDISHKAKRLFDRLLAIAPDANDDVPVYDRITVGVGEKQVRKIIKSAENGGRKAAVECARELFPKSAVVRSYCGDPQEHFNYDTFEESMPVGELVERWNQDSEEGANGLWQEELYMAIASALLNRPECSVKTPFKSLANSQYLLPLLARFRFVPYEEIFEFDILFCKVDTGAAERMLNEAG